MLRVRILDQQKHFFKKVLTHYTDIDQAQGIRIFFPSTYKYIFVDEKDEADICVVGCQHEDNSLLRSNELNIFITVENMSVGRTHYKYFNKYGRYNDKISLYYFNDVPRLTHNVIPVHLCFMKNYRELEQSREYGHITQTDFDDKLFCLAISRNTLNPNKQYIINELSRIGRVDHISAYDHLLADKSCYNTPEILGVFNRYKFIICFENSKSNGYITEKIFNVFLSKSIPIYDGAPDIDEYINEDAYIKYDEFCIYKVMSRLDNRNMYNSMITKEKFKPRMTEEFQQEFEKVFNSHLLKLREHKNLNVDGTS